MDSLQGHETPTKRIWISTVQDSSQVWLVESIVKKPAIYSISGIVECVWASVHPTVSDTIVSEIIALKIEAARKGKVLANLTW